MSGDTDASLSFGAKLQQTLAKLTDALTDSGKAFTGLINFLENPVLSPTIRKPVASKTGASLTYTFLDLGYPPSGKVWDVRQVSVWATGTDSFTQPAGVIAELIVARQVPSDGAGAPPIEHLVDAASAANLPYTKTWSRDEVTLVGLEHLVVMVKSIGTQVVQASAQCVEWDESQRRSWIAP